MELVHGPDCDCEGFIVANLMEKEKGGLLMGRLDVLMLSSMLYIYLLSIWCILSVCQHFLPSFQPCM